MSIFATYVSGNPPALRTGKVMTGWMDMVPYEATLTECNGTPWHDYLLIDDIVLWGSPKHEVEVESLRKVKKPVRDALSEGSIEFAGPLA